MTDKVMHTGKAPGRDIGNNIRKWRNLKGIKQITLAHSIGISKGTLSKMENNKTNVSVENLMKMSVVLDVKLTLLFTDPADLLFSSL